MGSIFLNKLLQEKYIIEFTIDYMLLSFQNISQDHLINPAPTFNEFMASLYLTNNDGLKQIDNMVESGTLTFVGRNKLIEIMRLVLFMDETGHNKIVDIQKNEHIVAYIKHRLTPKQAS